MGNPMFSGKLERDGMNPSFNEPLKHKLERSGRHVSAVHPAFVPSSTRQYKACMPLTHFFRACYKADLVFCEASLLI